MFRSIIACVVAPPGCPGPMTWKPVVFIMPDSGCRKGSKPLPDRNATDRNRCGSFTSRSGTSTRIHGPSHARPSRFSSAPTTSCTACPASSSSITTTVASRQRRNSLCSTSASTAAATQAIGRK